MEIKDHYCVGKAHICITNPEDCVRRIKQSIHEHEKGYVCVSNMRTVVIAYTTPEYLDVMENSLFNAPDGTPLMWCGRLWGLRAVERTCGPYLFDALLEDGDPDLRHFFLGDTDETLSKLTKMVQQETGATICGSYSPPFAPLNEYDFESIAKKINDSGANLVWTSLRAPKQDYLNARLLPYLNDGIVMVGVGAAFRYKIGELRVPDGVLQKIGLGGLLFKREGISRWEQYKGYIFLWCYLCQFFFQILFKRIAGYKYYE
mgnify:CR=1 FL=1